MLAQAAAIRPSHVSIPEHRSRIYNGADFCSTVQNGQTPLLLLSAELRVKIWNHSFGNKVIEVDFHGKRLRYTTYEDEIARRNQNPVHPLTKQLTCQQIFYETSYEMITTSSFHFDSPKAFRKFLLTKPDIVPQIHHLGIKCRAIGRLTMPARKENILDWARVLTPSYLSRFTSLRTVVLTFAFMSAFPFLNAGLLRQRDFSRSQMWTERKLPDILKAFQQHKLQEGTTGKAEMATTWRVGKYRRFF